uniref:non-specific serine/threonine protein kinase n=1 Tax=Equus asinus TaxID=9793 RepID=A0A9L0J6V3_EQUAS
MEEEGGSGGGAAGTSGDGGAGEEQLLTVKHELRTANLTGHAEKVGIENFELLKVLGTGAYGKVFLVRKISGHDTGKLYAMKVLKKATIVQKAKTTEHTRTERQVLEHIRQSPFLVTLHYAFQTETKLHLILDYINGGELFTHLSQRERFTEHEVQIYVGEIVLALEHLHKNLPPHLQVYFRIRLENMRYLKETPTYAPHLCPSPTLALFPICFVSEALSCPLFPPPPPLPPCSRNAVTKYFKWNECL